MEIQCPVETRRQLVLTIRDNYFLKHRFRPFEETCIRWRTKKAAKVALELGLQSLPAYAFEYSSLAVGSGPMQRRRTEQPATLAPNSTMTRTTSMYAGVRRPRAISISGPPVTASFSKPPLSTMMMKAASSSGHGGFATSSYLPSTTIPELSLSVAEWTPEGYPAENSTILYSPDSSMASPEEATIFANDLAVNQEQITSTTFNHDFMHNMSRDPSYNSAVFSAADMSRASTGINTSVAGSFEMVRISSNQSISSTQGTPFSPASLPTSISPSYSYPFTNDQAIPHDMSRSTSLMEHSIMSESSTATLMNEYTAPENSFFNGRSEQLITNATYSAIPVPMEHVLSADGTRKMAISRNPRTHQSREKLFCKQCTKHPSGFRGPHELQRHVDRMHNKNRKVWICIDASPDGTLLSNCKHCVNKKTYGAYYNAAAHLRRVHFHPKDSGPKVRGRADRAGKGGGDHPPMDELKAQWMIEIDENKVGGVPSSPNEDDQVQAPDFDQTPESLSFPTPPFLSFSSTISDLSDKGDPFMFS